MGNTACYEVKQRSSCCMAIDSRYDKHDGIYGGQRCIPSKGSSKYKSGNVCEPEGWVYSDDAGNAGMCPDTGYLSTAMYYFNNFMAQLKRQKLEMPSLSDQGVKITLLVMAMSASVLVLVEFVVKTTAVVLKPGDALDDLIGKGIFVTSSSTVVFLFM